MAGKGIYDEKGDRTQVNSKYSITKEGIKTWRQLKQENEQHLKDIGYNGDWASYAYSPPKHSQVDMDYNKSVDLSGIPKSMWDRDISNWTLGEQLEYIQSGQMEEDRAKNQPWYAKIGAGLGKGVLTAGTTFIDGTVGLITGLGTGIYNIFADNNRNFLDGLFDNVVSNAMHDLNEWAEEVMPNYYTQEELENKEKGRWEDNIFTANFVGEVLKNAGFTVGALYSANKLNLLLKGVGAIKSGMGALATGSLLSGLNEARVEANNTYHDLLDYQTQQINDSYDRIYSMSDEELDLAIQERIEQARKEYEDEINPKQKQGEGDKQKIIDKEGAKRRYEEQLKMINNAAQQLREIRATGQGSSEQVEASREALLNQAEQDALRAGRIDMEINTPLLSASEAIVFSKMFTRGYKSAKTAVGTGRGFGKMRAIWQNANEALGAEGLSEGVGENAGKYVWKDISKGRRVFNIARNAALEGNEEMWQEMASSFAGHISSPDSPDAWYNAMINGEEQVQTESFLTALVNSFNESYADWSKYDQFLCGAIMSLTGVPTFGKRNNASSNTLGRNKFIGLTGGAWGEWQQAKETNKRGREAVKNMNDFMDKVRDKKNWFVQTNFFSDAMDGFAVDDNKFEFKNAEDNSMAVAFNAFMSTGREQRFREIVNQDYENMSQEQLHEIAQFMNGDSGQWTAADGNLMSDNPQDMEEMRNKLIEKRDETLKQLDEYKDALLEVRASSSESLSQNEEAELAWAKWKTKRANARFNDIGDTNGEELNQIKSKIQEKKNALKEIIDNIEQLHNPRNSEVEKEGQKETAEAENKKDYGERFEIIPDEAGGFKVVQQSNGRYTLQQLKNMYTNLSYAENVISDLQNKDIDNISSRFKSRKLAENTKKGIEQIGSDEFYDLMGSDMMDYSKYKSLFKDILDATKLADAYRLFNEKYREYIIDPLILRQNHRKANKKEEKRQKDIKNKATKEKFKNSTPRQIANDVHSGQTSLDELEEARNGGSISKDDYDKAQKILKTMEGVNSEISKANFASDTAQEALNLWEAVNKKANGNEITIEDINNLGVEDMVDKSYFDSLNEKLRNGEITQEDYKRIVDATNQRLDRLKSDLISIVDKVNKQNAVINDVSTIDVNENDINGQNPPDIDVDENEVDENPPNVSVDERNAGSQTTGGVDPVDQNSPTQGPITDIPDLDVDESDLGSGTETSQGEEGAESIEDIPTPLIDKETIDNQRKPKTDDKISDANTSLNQRVPIANTRKYWRFTTTEFPIHQELGDKPWYETAEAKKTVPKAKLAKYEKLYKFLKEAGVFARRNSNNPDDKISNISSVRFGISKQLTNDLDGTIVVLMLDKDGRIIGDLPSYLDKELLESYEGLKEFVSKAKELFDSNKDSTKDDIYEIPGYESHVADIYIGRPQYKIGDETLNDINTNNSGNPMDFQIGILMPIEGGTSIISKARSNGKWNGRQEVLSKEEMRISRPLNGKVGQPYLLMSTSDPSRALIPVPVLMPTVSKVNRNCGLLKLVRDVFEELDKVEIPTTGKKAGKSFNEWRGKLSDFLNIPGGITIQKNQNSITGHVFYSFYLKDAGGNLFEIFTCSKTELTDGTAFNKLIDADGANGVNISFQVSRKFINTKDKLKDRGGNSIDYNRLLGEIMTTNLPQGANHTVNDFFTINPFDSKTGKEIVADEIPSAPIAEKAKEMDDKSSSISLDGRIAIELKSGDWIYMKSESPFDVIGKDGKQVKLSAEQKAFLYCKYVAGFDVSNPEMYYKLPGELGSKPFCPAKMKFGYPKIGLSEMQVTEANKIQTTDKGNNDKFSIVQDVKDENGNPIIVELDGEKLAVSSIEMHVNSADPNKPFINITLGACRENEDSENGIDVFLVTIAEQKLPSNLRALYKKNSDKLLKEYREASESAKEKVSGNFGDLIALASDPKEGSKTNLPVSKNITITNISMDSSGIITLTLDDEDKSGYAKFPFLKSLCNTLGNPTDITEIRIDSIHTTTDLFVENGSVIVSMQVIYNGKVATKHTIEVQRKCVGSYINKEISKFISEDKENETIAVFGETKPQIPSSATANPIDRLLTENPILNDINYVFEAIRGDKELTDMVLAQCKTDMKAERFRNKILKAKISQTAKKEDIKEKLHELLEGKGTRNREVSREVMSNLLGYKIWDERKELRVLNKILPQLSREGRISVVKGLLKVYNKKGKYAYGRFRNGIVILSDQSEIGTSFHEAFHYVFNTLLSEDEINAAYRAAKEKYGDYGPIALEEALAEDFRNYMIDETESKFGKIRRIWRRLKHMVQSLVGNENVLDKLYYDIANAHMANRESYDTKAKNMANMMDFISSMQETNEDGELLAPNGNVTNLSPVRHALVRTKEFISWADESLVVDRNGEPIVLYASPDRPMGVFTTKPKTDGDLAFFVKGNIEQNKKTGEVKMVDTFSVKSADNISAYVNEQTSRGTTTTKEINENMSSMERQRYHEYKLRYDNLTKEQKDFLDNGGMTEEEWEVLDTDTKDLSLACVY